MKWYILLVAFFASQLAIMAQDDVYYDPKNDKGLKNSSGTIYQNQFEKKSSPSNSGYDDALPGNTDPYKYDDGSSADRSNKTDGYTTNTTRNSNTSYYFDDDYDYYYTSRLRRFYAPSWGCGFWDPWYTDLFFYTGNPMFWGSNIYVSVLPRWSWWRPRQYVIVYDYWGWNSWGWNQWYAPWNGFGWNNWGWNNWYGGGWNGWGWNNWAWNNGYWHGYNQGYWNGYLDGMYGNWYGNGWYGKTYDAYGPRFQQTSANSGSNSLPGKYGKTDETIQREGILKPGTNTNRTTTPAENTSSDNSVVKPSEPRNAPTDGWRTNPNTTESPRRNVPTEVIESYPRTQPNNVLPERNQPENSSRWNNMDRNNNMDRSNNRWSEMQREQPNVVIPRNEPNVVSPSKQPSRTNEIRERLNRDMEPVQRPQRNFEPQQTQPQRGAPQRNFQPAIEQRNMQRFENGNRQMEMRQMQPMRMERSEPMQRNFDMNRGGGGGNGGLRRRP